MYNLVHTHTKTKIVYALSYATHTFYISPQYQACSKSRERYNNSCNPQKKKKKKTQNKIFLSFKNFQCFRFFFFKFIFNNQNNQKLKQNMSIKN